MSHTPDLSKFNSGRPRRMRQAKRYLSVQDRARIRRALAIIARKVGGCDRLCRVLRVERTTFDQWTYRKMSGKYALTLERIAVKVGANARRDTFRPDLYPPAPVDELETSLAPGAGVTGSFSRYD